ncbi:DNA repair protein RecO [Lentibacillus sp. JNUCC-1]|nr:DNA repair protein RecO [Lentibacillus sp. JNUCC-1]
MMYELKLFHKGGFAPVLDRCAICGRAEMPYAFSISEGGFLCPRCRHRDSYAVTLNEALAKWMLVFMQTDLERIDKISVKEENINRLRSLLDAYYDQYGGYYLKSKRFLKQMDLLK